MFKSLFISDKQTIYYADVIYDRADNLLCDLKEKGINLKELDSIKHHKRRMEWLSIREIITQVMPEGEDIYYNQHRKPHFVNSDYHLSISHSFERVAVCIHKTKNVGIDIQRIDKKILKIKSRFLNEKEQNKVNDSAELLTSYWSMKEALFKIYGKNDVFLKQNFEIQSFDNSKDIGTAVGITCTPELKQKNKMEFQKLDDYIVAYNVFH